MKNKVYLLDQDKATCGLLQDQLEFQKLFFTDIIQGKRGLDRFLNLTTSEIIIIHEPNDNISDISSFQKNIHDSIHFFIFIIDENKKFLHNFPEGEKHIFIKKPFSIHELLSHLKKISRKKHLERLSTIEFGDYELSLKQNCLMNKVDNKLLKLTDKEISILKYLYDAQEECVEKDRLLKDIWGYKNDIDTHTIETHIYSLRKKIENTFEDDNFLITEKEGYRLVLTH